MRLYYINGWREREGYFLSYGFTQEEITRMENGEVIRKGNNEFRIEVYE